MLTCLLLLSSSFSRVELDAPASEDFLTLQDVTLSPTAEAETGSARASTGHVCPGDQWQACTCCWEQVSLCCRGADMMI